MVHMLVNQLIVSQLSMQSLCGRICSKTKHAQIEEIRYNSALINDNNYNQKYINARFTSTNKENIHIPREWIACLTQKYIASASSIYLYSEDDTLSFKGL
eukprot:760368_1